MFGVVHVAGVHVGRELAAGMRGQARFRHVVDQGIVLQAVVDQVGDRRDLEAVFNGEGFQVGQARHTAVFVHDLANDAGRPQTGQPREVDRAFRLAGAHQHTALARAERKDVTRHDEIFGPRIGPRGFQNRRGPVFGRHPARHPLPRIERHGERGAERRGILVHHHRQAQRVDAFLGHRQADQPPTVLRHEVDGFGRDFFRGHAQVALVLAVFVVHQDNHPAGPNFLDRLLNGRDMRAFMLGRAGRHRKHGPPRLGTGFSPGLYRASRGAVKPSPVERMLRLPTVQYRLYGASIWAAMAALRLDRLQGGRYIARTLHRGGERQSRRGS